MRRGRRIAVILLAVAAVFGGCCGLPLYWLHHQRMHERPELIYPHYERKLHAYGRRLEAGDVLYVEGRGVRDPSIDRKSVV